jgi:membrane protease YdiL (CAAX protease family)
VTWLDLVFTLAIAVVWPAMALRQHRGYQARVRAGVPGARLAAYATGVITQWLLAATVVALWIHLARQWSDLGLARPAGWHGWVATGVAAALGGLLLAQSAMVARRPETHAQVREAMAGYAELLPVRRSDLSGFSALSITAGICEELLFRGYLAWVLAHWLGGWGGQAGALLVFGVAHSYLGRGAVLRAMVAGAAAAGLYLWSGSLIPSMLLHALIDLSSGWMGYIVLAEDSRKDGEGKPIAAAAK